MGFLPPAMLSMRVAEKPFMSRCLLWYRLEINVGIIAASIPTLKPLFTRQTSVFRHLRYRISSPIHRKSDEVSAQSDSEDGVGLTKLTIGTMPSAMPTSLSYYQTKGLQDIERWEDLESQSSTVVGKEAYSRY